jgi:hypothetical protein
MSVRLSLETKQLLAAATPKLDCSIAIWNTENGVVCGDARVRNGRMGSPQL